MTHDELLSEINEGSRVCELDSPAWSALRAVVELCKESQNDIDVSGFAESIIEAIELELNG